MKRDLEKVLERRQPFYRSSLLYPTYYPFPFRSFASFFVDFVTKMGLF